MEKILLVDDDTEQCALTKEYLETETLKVDCVYDGRDALDRLFGASPVRYDLLILDVMLPGPDGFEVLAEVRKRLPEVPVLMLTARRDLMDKVAGLESGADDYICKPCDSRELAARITARLRLVRTGSAQAELPDILRMGDLELDRSVRVARVGGNVVDLTDAEFCLLDLLLKNAGNCVSLGVLSWEVLGRDHRSDDRSLNTHICRLRQKLGPHSDDSCRIKSLRNKGFLYSPYGSTG